MDCQCRVVNNSGVEIVSLVLFHAPGTIAPGTFQQVLTGTNIPNGATVGPASASQLHLEDDWWAMGIQFAGNPTQYFLADDVLPFAECETPGNGSASIVIGPAALGIYACTIETFENSDFTDSDGNCNEQVVDQAALDSEDELAEEIIEMIAEALGEL
jgi:hypothetical protein